MKKATEAGPRTEYLATVVLIGSFVFLVAFTGCSEPLAGTSLIRKAPDVDDSQPVSRGATLSSSPSRQVDWAIDRYTPIVRRYSDQYGIDWLLVLAVMEQESKFDHDAVSHRGAYGLMQLMPITQIELTEKLGISETVTPRNNIRAGVYHLRGLYSSFAKAKREDRTRIALAAYNAGIGRIQDAQRIAAYLGNDPNKWDSIREALPLLTKNNYTLHWKIWEDGRPSSGYFRDWHQTIEYVDQVLDNFQEFNVALR